MDVIVIGGGIMGSVSALALARRGARVLVLERSVPGAEASSAAAGILGAQLEAHEPGEHADLGLASRALWERFAAQIVAAAGVDVGYRRCGALVVRRDAASLAVPLREAAFQREAGLVAPALDASEVAALEPALAPMAGGVSFPDDGQVDPPRLLRALQIAVARAGATVRSGAQVRGVAVDGGRARGVVLEDGTTLPSDHVVLAAGSWSSLVSGVPLAPGDVRPVRGQIVELSLRVPVLSRVVFGPGGYLVPRADGRVLVGSTMEHVGFHKDVTAKAVRDLLVAATALVPALEEASLTGTWASFRPFAEKVLLGESAVRGLVLATGHHRNGILLAPITGEIVAAAIEGKAYDVPRVTRPAPGAHA